MRSTLLTLAALTIFGLSACASPATPARSTGSPRPSPSATGTSTAAPNSASGTAVFFAGSASCPIAGATPYNNGFAPKTNGPAVGQAIAEMPHTHAQPPEKVDYLHDPPTSGCHYSIGPTGSGLSAPMAPGVYDQAIPPEYWVHNLEHGYVVVLYNCPSGCPADLNQLRSWYTGLAGDPLLNAACPSVYGLVAPYAKVLVVSDTTMQPKFAAVSWDWYDAIGSTLDINEVQRFYANHLDQAPEPGVC